MAGNLAQDIESKILDAVFNGGSYSGGSIYVGVATAPIASGDGLADITEEADSGYQRVTATFTAPSVVNGKTVISNVSTINIGTWDANAASPITHGFITDAQTGTTGDVLAWFEFVEPYSPEAGGVIQIPVGSLEVTLN